MLSSLQAETRPNVHLNSRIEPIEPLHCARRVIARRYPPLSNAPTVEVRFARDSLLEGAGFEPSVPGRLQAKTPRFVIVLRRLLSSCGSFHIDHRLSCHVSPLIEFTV